MAKQLIAGNWKMHGTMASASDIASQVAEHWQHQNRAEIIVFPPFVHLSAVSEALASGGVALGAQNLSEYSDGAYTGEISARMLVDQGCSYVLVGHSERRALFAENDATVAKKFEIAQQAGLTPILCVGESLQERRDNKTLAVVAGQIAAVIERVGMADLCRGVIAYEPVWAIGTGETASPEQAQAVHRAIRAQLGDDGSETSLLYGGSVNATNAAELFAQSDIDGGLVGGASLKADIFLNIAQQLVEQE
jgi:triosephosphate isomerase